MMIKIKAWILRKETNPGHCIFKVFQVLKRFEIPTLLKVFLVATMLPTHFSINKCLAKLINPLKLTMDDVQERYIGRNELSKNNKGKT